MGPAGFPLDERESRAAVHSIYQTFLRYGFTVYSHAFSNYDNTFDSTISLLNLRVSEPGKEGESSESEQHSCQDYRLLAYFRDKGYLLNLYQPSVFDIVHPVPPANSNVLYDYSRLNVMHDLAMPWTDRLLLLGGRFSVENLALRLVDKNLCAACGRYGGVYFTTQWAFEVLDLLEDDLKIARQDSLFFAHLLTPHFSYVHRPDGSVWPASILAHSTPPGSLQVGEPRYRDLHGIYAGQVQYLNRRLRAFFEQLDRRNLLDRTTVIVHGDHGARLLGKGRRTSPFRRLLEAYSTLLAVRMAPTRQGRVDSRKGSVLRFLAEELYGTPPDLTAASESVYVTNSDGVFSALPFLDLWREWAEDSPPRCCRDANATIETPTLGLGIAGSGSDVDRLQWCRTRRRARPVACRNPIWKRCSLLLSALTFLAVGVPEHAYGYIDPGTGSMLVQVTIGAIAAGLTLCKLYWKKIVGLFRSRPED